jgi:hypothetical protein
MTQILQIERDGEFGFERDTNSLGEPAFAKRQTLNAEHYTPHVER